MTDETFNPRRTVRPIPGTRRTFGGVACELGDSPSGYLYKRDSRILHATDCGHGPNQASEPRTREAVIDAWRAAPDVPIEDLVDPRFCQTCLAWPVDLTQTSQAPQRPENIAAVSKAAHLVLDHLLRDRRSLIDPTAVIWTAEHAERLRAAIEDEPDLGSGTFFEKLEGQLAGMPREVLLLTAEILYLRALPLVNVTAKKKREYVQTVLAWLPEAPAIPAEMEEGLRSGGTFHGGQGYNRQIWLHVPWFARFVKRWAALSDEARGAAREDPWAFRAVVVDDPNDQPAIRNSLLFMTFPNTFESVVNDSHKLSIRDAFADVIGGPSGSDGESMDRDLRAIRERLETDTAGRIDWYAEPWHGQWKQEKGGGDRAWAVRTKPAGRELIDVWLSDGYVSLAATHLDELPEGADRASVRERINSGYDHLDYAQRMYLTEDYHEFLSRMREGDVVAARHDDQVWLGRIAGPVRYEDEAPRLRRNVDWRTAPFRLEELPAPAPARLASPQSVIDLTEAHDGLLALIAEEPELEVPELAAEPPTPVGRVALPAATPELATGLHMEQTWLDEVITILDARRQVIVYGPPGTGKTFLARRLARHVTDDSAVQLVQFHPSYAYEDFFEGYRPTPQADGGLGFELRPGPLRRIAAMAANDPGTPYVLIIDEINRGNIAKVFGELYFLLEYRGEKVALQYSPEGEFSLPDNLFVIGTMNTADRSIALVDAAIRRRFSFVEMHPDSEPVSGLLGRWLSANHKDGGRAELLAELNAELGDANRDFQIGPSYLMRPEAETDEGLERVWKYDLQPLLEEHFYGQLTPAQVAERFGLTTLRRRIGAQAEPEELAGDEDESGEFLEPGSEA